MSHVQPNQYPAYVPQPYPGQPVQTYAVPAQHVPAKADAVRVYRRQSLTVHVILALLTGGLGNVVYAKWTNACNKYRR